RPGALVTVRAGVDGGDVSFHVGPASAGQGLGTLVGDGTGIRYVAFCYDAEPDPVAGAAPGRPAGPARAGRGLSPSLARSPRRRRGWAVPAPPPPAARAPAFVRPAPAPPAPTRDER